MKQILLVTSTIAPSKDAFLLAHNDPEKRLQDYVKALAFHVRLLQKKLIDGIVYADNSGYDLSALRKICDDAGVLDRCEFISFNTPAQPNLSRYYLEINLMIEAFARSEMLAQDDIEVWKVTGRYLILNAEKIVRRAPKADLYINCRNRPKPVIDFYFVRFTKPVFYNLLAAGLDDFANITTGEDILRERIDVLNDPTIKVVPRFNETPHIIGTRGWDGLSYHGVKDTGKYYFRYWMNKVLPGVWI